MDETTAISVLTIYDVFYFKENVTVFTCHGENGVNNYIGSPENDSVEIVFVCESTMHYFSLIYS